MTGSFEREDALLKYFNELLIAQRDRFQLYLELLNKQKSVIEGGGVEYILAYVEAGEKIAADILAIQRVIEPFEKSGQFSNVQDVVNMRKTLDRLRQDVRCQMEENKNLLSKRMALLAVEIKAIHNNPMRSRTSTPSFIDVKM